jgi:hypothetical protein
VLAGEDLGVVGIVGVRGHEEVRSVAPPPSLAVGHERPHALAVDLVLLARAVRPLEPDAHERLPSPLIAARRGSPSS